MQLASIFRDPLAIWRFLRDPQAPKTWRFIALVTLVYVLLPLDMIPDAIPGVGWIDDLGIATLAMAIVAAQAARYESRRLAAARWTTGRTATA